MTVHPNYSPEYLARTCEPTDYDLAEAAYERDYLARLERWRRYHGPDAEPTFD